jgi:hypothetical protein
MPVAISARPLQGGAASEQFRKLNCTPPPLTTMLLANNIGNT